MHYTNMNPPQQQQQMMDQRSIHLAENQRERSPSPSQVATVADNDGDSENETTNTAVADTITDNLTNTNITDGAEQNAADNGSAGDDERRSDDLAHQSIARSQSSERVFHIEG